MFSPDNFYNVFRSHYSWPKSPNVLMVFTPHGARSCMNLSDWLDGEDKTAFHQMSNGDMFTIGRTIMHDQEPVLFYFLNNTYIEEMRGFENSLGYQQFIERANQSQIFASEIATARVPIFCHSELNSKEVQELGQNMFVPCYYWWHGMIARDWFRHWQYYPELQVRDKSHASYRFLLYARGQDGTRMYRRQVVKSLDQYRRQIKYHWDSESQVSSEYSAKIDIADACDSAIHIVAETIFNDSKIHLTEKVFKPMVMSQPFVLYAGPGSLSYLRDYGFKTFDGIWDESYDQETDHRSRFLKITELVKKLCDLPQDEFSEIYKKTLPIVDHNRERFFSHGFQQFLMQEMHNNYADALIKQRDLQQQHPGGQWFHMLDRLRLDDIEIPSPFLQRTRSVLQSPLLTDRKDILRRYPELLSLPGL